MSAAHDHSYKLLFSHPQLVRDLLLEFVPVLRPKALELDTLQRVNASYVADSGQARHSDVVWKIRLAEEWVYIYLLLEFQSQSDLWMALRMQVYVGLLCQDLVSRSELSAKGKLPPVLPIVLYNGASSWRAAKNLAELMVRAPPGLQSLQPEQRYVLIEETAYDPSVLDSKTNLVAALFRLEHSRTVQDMQQLITRLGEWLTDPADITLRRDFAKVIGWLLRRKAKDPTIPEMSDLTEVQSMLAERRLDWWEEWMLEGEKKGRLVGEVHLLRRQLTHRFGVLPVWVQEKLAEANEEQLTAWAESVIEAKTLELVFSR